MNSKPYPDASQSEVDQVINRADKCFLEFRKKSSEERSDFLNQIASQIQKTSQTLLATAQLETNLGLPRLELELTRTINQLKEFASLAKHEAWKDYSSDTEDISRDPIPKPAMIREIVPIGPDAVIGDCNFPFAISVVGTDTAGALAVGCPVIVKSHPSHPQTL